MKAGKAILIALFVLGAAGVGVLFLADRSRVDSRGSSDEPVSSERLPVSSLSTGTAPASHAADQAGAAISGSPTGAAASVHGAPPSGLAAAPPEPLSSTARDPTASSRITRPVREACPQDASATVLSPPGWQMSLRSQSGQWQDLPGAALVDTDHAWEGSQSVRNVPGSISFVLWQAVDARPFRGKRVEISASTLTTRNAGGGVPFVRSFSGVSLPVLRSASDRSDVIATWRNNEWHRRSVYIDVADSSEVLLYGVRLGDSWIDDVRLSVLDAINAPLPGIPAADFSTPMPVPPGSVLPRPRNLDFEEPGIPVPAVRLQDKDGQC